MNKFMMKTTLAVLIAGVVYLLFFSIVKVDRGMVSVVEDLRSHKAVALARPAVKGYAFVWQGALPWWFVISEVPAKRAARFNAGLVIPGLEGLKEQYYRVVIPLRISYAIDSARFADAAQLGLDGSGLDDMVGRLYERELQRELARYLAPVYQREMLAVQADTAVETVTRGLMKELGDGGVVLAAARVAGTVVLPGQQVYNEGIAHAADLRNMDKMIEKSLIDVRSSMERDRIKNEQFYDRLKEISKIISANPDILKYIYIDKMAGNVKVILSSDNSGIPSMLEREAKPAKGKSREVDNLR
jgi:hypothetical protein